MEREWLRLSSNEERAKNRPTFEEVNLFLSSYLRKLFFNFLIFKVEQQKGVYVMHDGYVTTAEPRPNAYVPQNDTELPLPKPYGRLAPFKPQEPGSTMRHIKKPNPKPIEI